MEYALLAHRMYGDIRMTNELTSDNGDACFPFDISAGHATGSL